MAAPSVTQATSKIHEILEPIASDERRRIVGAALTLLGDEPSFQPSGNPAPSAHSHGHSDSGNHELPTVAQQWMRKNSLEMELLEQYFHFDADSVKPIELPSTGKAKREKTINTYLMQGIASLLSTGDSAFADETARHLCEHFGCYDRPNHGKYLRQFGNQITGSKSAGWKLTAPGLAAAAASLKQVGT